MRERRGRTKENFLVAAELGHVDALARVGDLLHLDDPRRFFWLGKAASNGRLSDFLIEMKQQIRHFNRKRTNVVFVIGRALKGKIDKEKRTIFGKGFKFDSYIDSANQALHFYNFQLQSYRKAVDSWTIVGLRNNVVKDIRNVIGKMIWDAREEATYSEEI
jgi:hypothetical protein